MITYKIPFTIIKIKIRLKKSQIQWVENNNCFANNII